VAPGLTLFFDMHTRQFSEGVVNVTGEVTCKLGKVASLEFVFAQASADSLPMSS
jgi:hypothetical protein